MQEDTDIIVIGGGISGLGAALEARARGFGVVLLESQALAQATSANSLRIIHGGLRYLQHLNFRRVLESAREQALLSHKYGEFVQPLRCVMPLARHGAKSSFPMKIAAHLFKYLTANTRGNLSPMEVFGKDDVSRLVPALKDIAPHGAFSWHDLLLLDHAGFVLALRKELEQLGGVVRTNSRVIELAFDKRWTVMTKDGDKVRAPVVINASGPWCTELLPKQAPSHFRQIPAGWCAALNLEFDFSLDSAAALACQSQSGRLLFLVPRGEGAALGTWYYPCAQLRSAEVLEQPPVLDSEIEKFIEEARVAFKDDRFERSRVRHIDVGVLPMKRCGAQGPELYGRHVVRDWKGFIHLVSTKYTTFRLLGEEAIQAAAPYLRNL